MPSEPVTEVELEETYRLIQQGDDYVQLEPETDIVLLLGITGAGKSTLSNFLAGINLTAVRLSPESANIYIVDEDEKINNIESQFLSHTIFPEKLVDPIGTVYYDTPGFSDTRSLAHEVVASYFIRRVIDYAERVKFLLVIGKDFLDSRTAFIELIVQTTSHIRNIDVFRDSIALIVTKVPYTYFGFINNEVVYVSEKQEIQDIATNLINIKKFIQDSKNDATISNENREKYALAGSYIDILLQKNGDVYTKIGLMRSPNQEGSLSDNKLMQESKISLNTVIKDNLKFVVKNADDLTETPMLERSIERIEKSLETIYQRIQDLLKDMIKRFEDFYEQKELELTDVFQFTDDFRQHVQVWNDFQRNYHGDGIADLPKQLQTTINQLNVTFVDEYLLILSMQTNYISMWHSVIPNFVNICDTSAIKWNNIFDPFPEKINKTMLWYDWLNFFIQILARQDVQLLSREFVEVYGIRNPNRSGALATENNEFVDLGNAGFSLQSAISALSFGYTNDRKSLINDIWDTYMQAATIWYDSATRTHKIHGFILKISHIMDFIKSREHYSYDTFELFAIDRIFIDVDLIAPNRNVIIIAPVWIIVNNRSISLNGKDGYGYSVTPPERHNGNPGGPGQPAGNFFGVSFEFQDSDMLTISAIGGRGGDGQNGGSGSEGNQGANFPYTHISKEQFNSKDFFYGFSFRFYSVEMDKKDYLYVYGKLGTVGYVGREGGAG